MENFIHPSAVIGPNVIIGNRVYIGPNCTIGYPAEYSTDFPKKSDFGVQILDGAKITGNVTIDAGTIKHTLIGKNSFLMKGTHIGHDVQVGTSATLSPHTCIGGHVIIGDYANLGMGCIVHPRQVIGAYCMIGMGTIIPKKAKILPGHIYVGNPSREVGINYIGLEKLNINESDLNILINKFISDNLREP